jgi:hypothetical protein
LQLEGDDAERDKDEQDMKQENFGSSYLAKARQAFSLWNHLVVCRSRLWDFLEKPWTSDAAGSYAVLSLLVILVSTATFIISTVEELQTSVDVMRIIDTIDTITVVIFTLEYLLR